MIIWAGNLGSELYQYDLPSVLKQLLIPNQQNMSFFEDVYKNNITTLAPHNLAQGQVGGFVYVPDLDQDDPCYNLSKSYIPSNATRRQDLPHTDFSLCALAPWINAECAKSYLAAARNAPTRAFLFYQPDIDIGTLRIFNGTGTLWSGTKTQVAPADSSIWDLQDGGAWKKHTIWPVYAVAPWVGNSLMQASSVYSGNITSIPYGRELIADLWMGETCKSRLHSKERLKKWKLGSARAVS